MGNRPDSHNQTMDVYRSMSIYYRPAAPSDGFGNISIPFDQLNLNEEAERYANLWMSEEDLGNYRIGCPAYEGRPALIYILEAGRATCGVNYPLARRLLEEAQRELDILDRR